MVSDLAADSGSLNKRGVTRLFLLAYGLASLGGCDQMTPIQKTEQTLWQCREKRDFRNGRLLWVHHGDG